jgi:murein DD-endopeptidase MepM/ murein hydrolase activator NlpD
MKLNKFISILLIFVFIFNVSIYSIASNETNIQNQEEQEKEINTDTDDINDLNNQRSEIKDKLDEANIKLEYLQTEISEILIQIQQLDDKIRKYENENAELEKKLNELETSAKETTEKLNAVTEEYNKKEQQLRERLVALYEAGSISYLDVLLSSRTLSEFLSRYYKMLEVMEYDNQLINTVEEEKNTIEIAKQKLDKETDEIKTLKLKVEQNKNINKNTKTLQEGYMAKLSKSEKKLNEKITKYKTETIQLETRIREISMANGDYDIQYTGGLMIWPVAIAGTKITSDYGTRQHPIQGVTNFHLGIDIGNAGFGAPAVAALGGVVTYAGELGSYGNCVIINHGDGISTLYGHGQKILVEFGQTVQQGDIIMEVGSTGNSTGPHLHFEVRINGKTVDPLNYVKEP